MYGWNSVILIQNKFAIANAINVHIGILITENGSINLHKYLVRDIPVGDATSIVDVDVDVKDSVCSCSSSEREWAFINNLWDNQHKSNSIIIIFSVKL